LVPSRPPHDATREPPPPVPVAPPPTPPPAPPPAPVKTPTPPPVVTPPITHPPGPTIATGPRRKKLRDGAPTAAEDPFRDAPVKAAPEAAGGECSITIG